MAEMTHGDTTIRYEELGSGFPLLLLAPGGLNSTIERWELAALNPLVAYAGEFRLIAMDQRNAGESRGPFAPSDPWGSFIDDQLALADHVGAERFAVMGCCIGCSYALKLIERAPERIAAAVLEQPIGITEENAPTWLKNRREWVEHLVAEREELDADAGERFGSQMWDDGEFVVAVTRDFVRQCTTPLAVLPGIDLMHPNAIGREVGTLAPNAELIEPWKDSPENLARATEQVRAFLQRHTGV